MKIQTFSAFENTVLAIISGGFLLAIGLAVQIALA